MMRKLWPLMLLVVISACLSDSSGSPTVTDTTTTPVTVTVTMSPTAASLILGQTQQFTANASSGTVTWSVSNSLVATVSPTGLVTAKGTGTATVSAVSGTGSSSAQLTVSPSGIAVTPISGTLAIGQSLQLLANVNDGTGGPSPVTWSFSDPTVGSVSGAGLFSAKGTGIGTVTAAAANLSATASLTVTPSGITVTPAITSLIAGQKQTFTATVADGTGRTSVVRWSFSNGAVATVASDVGLLTTIGPGTGTLNVSASGYSKDIAFTVTPGSVDQVTVCDRSALGQCVPNATLMFDSTGVTRTAVDVRATAYNTFGADITGTCVFQWSPLLPNVVQIQTSTDAMKRDALITRLARGPVSVLVTCGAVVGVFTIN